MYKIFICGQTKLKFQSLRGLLLKNELSGEYFEVENSFLHENVEGPDLELGGSS